MVQADVREKVFLHFEAHTLKKAPNKIHREKTGSRHFCFFCNFFCVFINSNLIFFSHQAHTHAHTHNSILRANKSVKSSNFTNDSTSGQMEETLNTRWDSTGSRVYYKPHVFFFSFWPCSSIKPASSQNLRHYLQLLLSGQTVVTCNINVPGDNKGLCLWTFLELNYFDPRNERLPLWERIASNVYGLCLVSYLKTRL